MLPIVIVLAVPQFAVVIFALPLKDVPFMVLAVAKVVAVAAFPVTEMPQVPDAPLPVFVGTYDV